MLGKGQKQEAMTQAESQRIVGGVVHEFGEITMTWRDIHDITKGDFQKFSV